MCFLGAMLPISQSKNKNKIKRKIKSQALKAKNHTVLLFIFIFFQVTNMGLLPLVPFLFDLPGLVCLSKTRGPETRCFNERQNTFTLTARLSETQQRLQVSQ